MKLSLYKQAALLAESLERINLNLSAAVHKLVVATCLAASYRATCLVAFGIRLVDAACLVAFGIRLVAAACLVAFGIKLVIATYLPAVRNKLTVAKLVHLQIEAH